MIERTIGRTIVATAAALLFVLSTPAATAEDGTLHLLVSNGMKGSMEALQSQFEKETGLSARDPVQFHGLVEAAHRGG